ncbi:MAG TPA: beta-galactosidase [Candidatus Limiplasma sp.]|nr:beta-galactosidase [Candidatus Limiplasma sp.]
MDKSIKQDSLQLGVCYYPEHWNEALWPDDLRRMAVLGIHTVRVFEFAWSIVQPKEDVFDFSLFDRFLDLAAQQKMNVIFCTPTATPPAWLTQAHPEVLNRTKDGKTMHHGHRRHYTYNSPVYNAYVKTIVTALAKRYGDHPAVIGWQIDNELNCEVDAFYAEADHAEFRKYLQRRFQTVAALNDAIGARFWSQSYSDWSEVCLEQYTPSGQGNPHLSLLAKAFFSDSAIRFAKLQSDILRQYIGDRFITTNGIFNHLDNHALTQTALDFIMYDSYPNFAYTGSPAQDVLKDRKWSMHLSKVRALSANFGVMEQQAGANGWDFSMMSPMPLPGQIRLWTMQSVGHGADYISYFRWRTAPYGTEIYWHGLNDYDNRPNRRLDEVRQVHEEFENLREAAGSRYEAKVAILTDYLNDWDGERDQWHGPMNRQSTAAIFAAAQHTHTPLDFINLCAVDRCEMLKQYNVIFYPHAAILTDTTAALLAAYCGQGGTLIMGARTGYKDEYGRCPMRSMPGPASTLCGVTVGEYSFPHPLCARELVWDGVWYDAPGFQETLIAAEDADTIAYFSDHAPGMTCKPYANGGGAYYFGCGFTEEIATVLLQTLQADHPFASLVKCPHEVELCVRRKGDTRYLFLLNYSDQSQTAELEKPMYNMFSNEKQIGSVSIPPFGVLVLRDMLSA